MKQLLIITRLARRSFGTNMALYKEGTVDIGGMRKPYHDKSDFFDMKDLTAKEPMGQFRAWFDEASANEKIYEANAMCLSTCSPSGVPSARMVLLKKFGKEGFTFFTNYTSRKAEELDSNPRAALVFYWEPLQRSVRVEGSVMRVDVSESESYFHSRPLSSQIGAAVSDQSNVISSRAILTDKADMLVDRHGSGEEPIPRPDWGGYTVLPSVIEFWQGQSDRIHDRIRFRQPTEREALDPELTHKGEDGWIIERLAP